MIITAKCGHKVVVQHHGIVVNECDACFISHQTCAVCSEPFTKAEWEERHSTPDGEDCHEHCCPECLEELTETLSPQERNPSFRSW